MNATQNTEKLIQNLVNQGAYVTGEQSVMTVLICRPNMYNLVQNQTCQK